MNKEELIEIYSHTKDMSKMFDIPLSEKHKYTNYLAISQDESQFNSNPSPKKAGNIIMESIDTVSALSKHLNLIGSSGKTAILNMANAKHKGGGVERGSMAQEECLFRCSNLCTIPDDFYPMAVDELIYTHNASFVKDKDYKIIWPMDADVITIAAPNLNKEHKDKEVVEDYQNVMKLKIASMLYVARVNKCDNIILGAWGCGAFKNDPTVVANLFKESLSTRRYWFKNVIFAIINDRNSVGDNYQIFHDILTDGVPAE